MPDFGSEPVSLNGESNMAISRKLGWNDDAQKWTCSECAWVFEPPSLFADRRLNKYFDLVRRDEEFVAHTCSNRRVHGKT